MKIAIPRYADEAAFPREEIKTDTLVMPEQWGLTKREYFAAMAMSGLVVSYVPTQSRMADLAEYAVTAADNLLTELEKAK